MLEGLSSALQAGVAWTFSAATLKQAGGVATRTEGGGVSLSASDVACMAKVDYKNSTKPDGGTVIITRILILKGSLTVEPKAGNSVAFTGGKTYKLGPVRGDGLGSHWACEVVDG